MPLGAKSPGMLSGGQSRRSSRAFKDRRVVRGAGRSARQGGTCLKKRGSWVWRNETRRIGAAIGVNVLYGFVGLVLMERTVIVMMMGFLLEVQDPVRKALGMIRQDAAGSDREVVPKQRYDHEKNGWRVAHVRNLTETV